MWAVEEIEILVDNVGCLDSYGRSAEDTYTNEAPLTTLESLESKRCCEPAGDILEHCMVY